MRSAVLLVSLLLLAGCRSGPTLEDAEDYLHEGDPENALTAARRAIQTAETDQERLSLRRVAFTASLECGWSHEAAKEYAHIRQLLGRDDDVLLSKLGMQAIALAGKSRDPSRRLRAAQTLRAIVDDGRIKSLLLAALGDEEPEVRGGAIRTAAELENPRVALDLLRSRVRGERHAVVRHTALAALTDLIPRLLAEGDQRRADLEVLLDLAIHAVDDADEEVRLAALELLSRLSEVDALPGDQRIADRLARAVGNGSEAVCMSATRKLLRIDPERAWKVWDRQGIRGRSFDAFGRALGLHVDQAGETAVRDDLASTSYSRRLGAVRGLLGPAARLFKPELLKMVRRDPAYPVRIAAVEALLAVGAQREVRLALRDVLSQGDADSRRHALLVLHRMSALKVTDLIPLFHSGDPALMRDTARLLAAQGDLGTRALVQGLDQHTTFLTALEVLAVSPPAALRERLRDLLQDRDPRVRRLAALGLVRCGGTEDRAQLVRSLERPTDDADLAAAAALLAIQASRPATTSNFKGASQ